MAERACTSLQTESQTVTLDEVEHPEMYSGFKSGYLVSRILTSCVQATRNASSFSGLHNVKVLDLTRIVAGPYATMILGDLGAKIYKVEAPVSGDECRNWPPNIGDSKDRVSCYFASLNRNKESICVNMKSEKGRKIIYDLAKVCDVLVENFVPGKLDELGFGYEKISAIAPQIVYCSVTGYGSVGPYKKKPGYDVIAASVGGLVHITGPEGGEPCKTGVALVDIATGLFAHGAILAALLERTQTGKGQKIDCNLLSTQIACLINIGGNYLNAGKEATRWGTAHESIVPYEAFKTADGFITVGAGSNGQFVDLCSRLKIPQLSQDERFLTNPLRVKNRKPLIKLLKTKLKEKTTAEWMKIFEGGAFPCGPVNTLEQVFNDPHVKEIGLVEELKLGSGEKMKDVRTVKLTLKKPKSEKQVKWREGTVDNENMNKKKSKCCCIYEKPKKFGDSSSESDDECENCFGHVEKRKKNRKVDDSSPTPPEEPLMEELES